MTEAEKIEFEKMKEQIKTLEFIVGILRSTLKDFIQQNGKAARSEARRLRNILDRDEKFAEFCEDLAASVELV